MAPHNQKEENPVTDSTAVEVFDLDDWIQRNRGIPVPIVNMVRALEIEATMDTEGPNPAVYNILSAILTADTENDILAAALAGTTSGKDFVDVPFRLRKEDIQWKVSGGLYRTQGAFPFYALCEVTELQTGERRVISCGGSTFCVVMWRFAQTGVFDPYYDEGGYPFMLKSKPAGIGQVLIPTKYFIPEPSRASAKTKA
jgi:hypothetical protein